MNIEIGLIVFSVYIMSLAFTEYIWKKMQDESFIEESTAPINWATNKSKVHTTLIWLFLPIWSIFVIIIFYFFSGRWEND